MDKPPEDATRKRKSEKADSAACSKTPQSDESTHVGIAHFVAQSSSTIDNSLTSCELVASHSPLNCSQLSDHGNASGALCTILANQSTISRDYTDSKFIAIDRTSQQPTDDSGPNKNTVGATLAFAQSGSCITQDFRDSQIHITSTMLQQSTDAHKALDNTEEIKNFEVAIGRRNREVKRIPQDVESVKRENLADMRYSKYFERDKGSVLPEYRRERDFAFEYLSSVNLLTYDKLIEDIEKREFKRLCIVGPAGYGKSTVISCLERDLSMSDKLVVFLNFSDIDYDGKLSPCELFFQSLDCDNIIEGYKWLVENQEKVIFLLDGLDQVLWTLKSGAPHVGKNSKCTASEIISNLFDKRLLPDILVVYTSREHVLSALDGELRPDKVVSITGFSNGNAMYLFTKELKDGEQLWDNMAASLKSLCSIPAFLTFTKYAYVRDATNPPSYLAEVMENLFSSFDTSDHNRRGDILTENEEKALGELSYHCLKQGKLTFKKEEFSNVGLEWDRILDFVIFVPGHGGKNRRLFDGHKVAFFLHQTVQEFFVGKHIVRMDLESFKNTVEQELKKDYWSVVRRFVAGLLLNKKSRPGASGISNYPEKQRIMKEMLKSEYRGKIWILGGVASALSTLASVAETEDSNFIQSFVKTISLKWYSVGISGMSSVSSVIRHCKLLEILHLEGCNLGYDGARLLWENIKDSGVKISGLNLSFNNLNAYCCEVIANIVTQCSVDKLSLMGCDITDAGLKRFLAKCKGAKISSLNLCHNDFNVDCCEVIANIVTHCSIDNLDLMRCNITDAGLNHFLAKCEGAKIFRLNFSLNTLNADCCEVIANIVTQCSVDELKLQWCKITDAGLKRFLAKCNGAKISSLNLSHNDFNVDCCDVVANIVTQCSVDELLLIECKITDAGLKRFLSKCKEAKLDALDVSYNRLSEAAIKRIRESITVEKLNTESQHRSRYRQNM